MRIQDLFNNYKKLSQECTEIESKMLADYTNENLEKEFDEAYQKEFAAWMELVKETQRLTGVDFTVAKAMVASDKFEELMKQKIA